MDRVIDKEDINRDTPLWMFYEYMDYHYPDVFKTGKVDDYEQGYNSGIIEIVRFMKLRVEGDKNGMG